MNDSILQKIKKLLNLSQCKSGNVNETAAAAARAAKLMAEHKISIAEVMTADENFDQDPVKMKDVFACQRLPAWRAILIEALCQALNCLALTSWRGLSVVGQTSDVDVVNYLFKVFTGDIERLCREWAKKTGYGGQSACRSFKIGAARALYQRMSEAKKAAFATASETALVHLDHIREQIIKDLNITGKARSYKAADDYFAENDGYRAGMKMNIAPEKALGAKKEELGAGK